MFAKVEVMLEWLAHQMTRPLVRVTGVRPSLLGWRMFMVGFAGSTVFDFVGDLQRGWGWLLFRSAVFAMWVLYLIPFVKAEREKVERLSGSAVRVRPTVGFRWWRSVFLVLNLPTVVLVVVAPSVSSARGFADLVLVLGFYLIYDSSPPKASLLSMAKVRGRALMGKLSEALTPVPSGPAWALVPS